MVYRKKSKTRLPPSPFSGILSAIDGLSCILYLLVLLSALLLVYSKHQARVWHAQKMQYALQAQAMQADWSQLLVDIGRWMNKNHLNDLAKAEGFQIPQQIEVIEAPD